MVIYDVDVNVINFINFVGKFCGFYGVSFNGMFIDCYMIMVFYIDGLGIKSGFKFRVICYEFCEYNIILEEKKFNLIL